MTMQIVALRSHFRLLQPSTALTNRTTLFLVFSSCTEGRISCHTQSDAAVVFHSTVSPIDSKFCYCLAFPGRLFTHFEVDFPLTRVTPRTVKQLGVS